MRKKQNDICRYWDPLNKKWYYKDCNSGGNYLPPVRCCIPPMCCIDCEFFEQFIDCFSQFNALFPPQTNDQNTTFTGFEIVAYLLDLVNCRYRIIPSGPVLTQIFDTQTNDFLRCYTNITLSNTNQPLPAAQCMLFYGGGTDCPDVGLCFYLDFHEVMPGWSQMEISDIRICKNANTVVDLTTLQACTNCVGIDVTSCWIQAINYFQDTYNVNPFGDPIINVSFDLIIPACCEDAGIITAEIVGDGTNISFAFPPLIVPGSNTVQLNVDIASVLGDHAFYIILRSENCGSASVASYYTVI